MKLGSKTAWAILGGVLCGGGVLLVFRLLSDAPLSDVANVCGLAVILGAAGLPWLAERKFGSNDAGRSEPLAPIKDKENPGP